jgi:hypothetical protein
MAGGEWWAELYPDIVAAGSLAEVVRQAVPDHDLADLVSEDQGSSARVKRGNRGAEVSLAREWPVFYFSLTQDGRELLANAHEDIGAVGGAIATWVEGATVSQVHEAYPFVPVNDWALAYEDGRAVEFEWERILDNDRPISTRPLDLAPPQRPARRGHPLVEAMLEAAARQPVLRQLYPVFDHGYFSFSRCTGYPPTFVGPSIDVSPKGTYRVEYNSRLEFGTAEEAVREVVSRMPPGCGPAIQGTPEEVG